MSVGATASSIVKRASPAIRAALEKGFEQRNLDVGDVVALLGARGSDGDLIKRGADILRREQAGDQVSYVVNRNINFTNVCVKRCGFCAFSRDRKQSQESYLLPTQEVVRRVQEAVDFGATEVCIQAGLPPNLEGDHYVDLCRSIKEAVPEVHVHGFSPEEVWYGARRRRSTVKEHLRALLDAGLGSLPGTSAEILDQELRNRISPGRIPVKGWLEVVRTAHGLGLPSSATVMYGHAETKLQLAQHLMLLRDVQEDTGGFTEFVPLSFVHDEAPMFRAKYTGLRPGPSWEERVLVHAVARFTLGRLFTNIQASWVKEGFDGAVQLLDAGANDLGGTLINESISTAAGASHGQLARPSRLRELIRSRGRVPAERTTVYNTLRVFDDPNDDPQAEPLDQISDEAASKLFGSYAELTRSSHFRFQAPGT